MEYRYLHLWKIAPESIWKANISQVICMQPVIWACIYVEVFHILKFEKQQSNTDDWT